MGFTILQGQIKTSPDLISPIIILSFTILQGQIKTVRDNNFKANNDEFYNPPRLDKNMQL